ncbi:MAG: UDP-N-acetylmuramoyl-L-alanine--D-glutamate ligase, partial [Alphaproteobacteria bacterium]|nr:UDP-N-acetylmuramoyl-L-alanine--D-glutamate ligase [Alphaproteobacteria bacterium]
DCKIIGDIEILGICLRDNPRGYKTVAITGTNGKSTTTALLTHVLNACAIPAMMGGNIGTPALALQPAKDGTIIVLEISSYQIDLAPTFTPDIGILLNITTDHIDRHGSFENYAAIKHRLLDSSAHKIYAEKLDQSVLNGHVFPMLPGAHNAQNIIAVLAACAALNIDQDDAIKAIKTFPGLAHRQYLARTIQNIHFINDSKGTNVEAAAKALGCHENIYWIVGGRAKTGGLSGLEKYKTRITHAYLIGESSPDFAVWMQEQNIPFTLCDTLQNAVPAAYQDAQNAAKDNDQNKDQDATILLSPACASWDQFDSFEHRGDTFIDIVEALS